MAAHKPTLEEIQEVINSDSYEGFCTTCGETGLMIAVNQTHTNMNVLSVNNLPVTEQKNS